MYQQVARKLVVLQGTDEFSQGVSLENANAVFVEVVMFHLSGGGAPSLRVTIQQSNDLENWGDEGSDRVDLTKIEYGTLQKEQMSSRYVRLKYSFISGSSSKAIVAAGIHTADL